MYKRKTFIRMYKRKSLLNRNTGPEISDQKWQGHRGSLNNAST